MAAVAAAQPVVDFVDLSGESDEWGAADSDDGCYWEVPAAPNVDGRRAGWAESPLRATVEAHLCALELGHGVLLSAYGNAAGRHSLVSRAEHAAWRAANTLFDMRRLKRTVDALAAFDAAGPDNAFAAALRRGGSTHWLKNLFGAETGADAGGAGEFAMACLLLGWPLAWRASGDDGGNEVIPRLECRSA